MSLTTRQVEVARLVARGMSNKQIARRLELSPNTVDHHIQSAAARIPGEAHPRFKLTLWVLNVAEDS